MRPTERQTLALGMLPPETQRQILAKAGRTRPRVKSFTAEHERRHALRVLALIADLTQTERRRVLTRATRINEV